jgi:glutathione S-transferase
LQVDDCVAWRYTQGIDQLATLVGDALGLPDIHLRDNPYVAGEHFTMGDIPLGVAVYRYRHLDIQRPDLPNIAVWTARLHEQAACLEHVMFEFGSNREEWRALESAGA